MLFFIIYRQTRYTLNLCVSENNLKIKYHTKYISTVPDTIITEPGEQVYTLVPTGAVVYETRNVLSGDMLKTNCVSLSYESLTIPNFLSIFTLVIIVPSNLLKSKYISGIVKLLSPHKIIPRANG